jgi:DNA-directed RNA polymerase specialized sigma24 family protein
MSIVYHPGQEEYHAQAWLKVPGKRFVSGRYSPWLDYSIMRCLAKLRRHVESYRENPNADAIRESKRQLELQNHVVTPTEHTTDALGQAIQRQDYRAFRRALSGYEDRMRAQVANWVRRYPQMTRRLGEDIEMDDIVEEVFLMAFEGFPERQEQTISEWLRHFIDPAVKAIWHDEAEREAADLARTFGTASELLAQPPSPSNRRAPK